jgi:hypothetical protein
MVFRWGFFLVKKQAFQHFQGLAACERASDSCKKASDAFLFLSKGFATASEGFYYTSDSY